GRELRDPCRELDRGRMGVAPVRVEAELLRLRRGRLAELRATVAGVHAEKGRQAVEIAVAVLVPHVASLAADEHRHLVVVVGAHPREMHPQMAPGLVLPGAGAGGLPLRCGLFDADFSSHVISPGVLRARGTCRYGQTYNRTVATISPKR